MESKNADQRNVMIDLGKFVYSLVIVFYHIYRSTGAHFVSGRYGVEFFLLAAGLFFFQSLEKHPDTPPSKRILKRFARFFPWSFSAYLFTFLVMRVVINGTTSFPQIAEKLSEDIWEALLVKMSGLNNGHGLLNSPSWTLSSMFLVEILLVGCCSTNRKVFVNILLPLSLIVGFGYWRMVKTAAVEDWLGFTTFSTFRTWMVYCCAFYCLKLSQYLRKIDLTRLAEALLTILEALCHIFAFVVMTHWDTRYFQMCTILALFVAVSIEASGHSLWNVLLRPFSRAASWLSSFSLSIFLMHRPVTRYFEMLYPETDVYYAHLLPMLAVIFVCSLAQYLLVTGLIRLWRKNSDKIKTLFVRNQTPNRIP